MDLNSMTVSELTKTWNDLTGRSLKKFDTKKQGIARIQKLLDERKAPEETAPRAARPGPGPGDDVFPVGVVTRIVVTALPEEDAPKTKKVTVSSEIRRLILDGLSNDEIWASVQPRFNLSADKKGYPAWYRRELNK